MNDTTATKKTARPASTDSETVVETGRKPFLPIATVEQRLGDLGRQLPVGVPVAGRYQRDFTLRKFTFEQERLIGEARSRIRGLTIGRYVSEIMSVLVKSVGPHDFDAMEPRQRIFTINQMQLGDVQVMYLWARIDSVGSELAMSLACPSCRHKYDFVANLNDLDVKSLQGDAEVDLEFDFDLRDGIEIAGATRNWLRCGPVTWGALDVPGVNSENALANPATREAAIIRGAVHGVDGMPGPYALLRGDIGQLSKWDKEGLISVLTDRMFGPNMVVDDECPVCQEELYQMMPWTFETFFTRSSRSIAKRS